MAENEILEKCNAGEEKLTLISNNVTTFEKENDNLFKIIAEDMFWRLLTLLKGKRLITWRISLYVFVYWTERDLYLYAMA